MSDFDFWTCNGSPDFGLIPAGVLGCPEPTPIRLQRGTTAWGAFHIQQKHWHWVQKHALSVPELAWSKCQQAGRIYDAEEACKSKIALRVHPSALMLLKYQGGSSPYFSISTLYAMPTSLDGTYLARYVDTLINRPKSPTFDLPPVPPPSPSSTPTVVVKKRKIFLPP